MDSLSLTLNSPVVHGLLIVLRSVYPEANPIGSVIPIDAVAVRADRSPYCVPIPGGCQGTFSIHLSACVVARFVAQLKIVATLPDGAGL